MKKEIIVSTPNTLGGSPRLQGRRLDVNHIVWGINEYQDGKIQPFLIDFELSINQIRHSILYCKDQICELQNVPQSCNGCSKKFEKNLKTWKDYLNSLNEYDIHLDSMEEHKKDFEGKDSWKIAQKLYEKNKLNLNLPSSYEKLITETNQR